MLYQILKIYVRAVIRLFCHSIFVDKKHLLNTNGPLLIASNHPNSFLDAIIFDIIFDTPVTSLARGDVFKNKTIFKLLKSLKMLPIYRIREGAKNLNTNYDTFDNCIKVFRQKEGVLIFSEGLCVNEWHLRALKKGTARLAFRAWSEQIPLQVLPAGINYSSFRKYGKKINIHFGNFINATEFDLTKSDGNNYSLFNEKLKTELQDLVYEIEPNNHQLLEKKFGKTSTFIKIILAPFALIGAIAYAPIYWLARLVTKMICNNNDHYDSIMLGFLLLIYPFYLIIISLIAYWLLGFIWMLVLLFTLPFTAFCYTNYEIRKGWN